MGQDSILSRHRAAGGSAWESNPTLRRASAGMLDLKSRGDTSPLALPRCMPQTRPPVGEFEETARTSFLVCVIRGAARRRDGRFDYAAMHKAGSKVPPSGRFEGEA